MQAHNCMHARTHLRLPPRMFSGRTHPLLLGPVPGFLFEDVVPLGEHLQAADIAWLLTSTINY